jgi:hypothetical protein
MDHKTKPSPKPVVQIAPTKTRKQELSDRISEIIKEHNGVVSDIGFTHEYWKLLNEFRLLNRNQ